MPSEECIFCEPREQQSWSNCKKATRLQELEQVIALVIGSPKFPVFCTGTRKCWKWGYEKGSTGWYKQEDKVLIPEAQQCKLPESLHDITLYGRVLHYGPWCRRLFPGKGLKRRVKQVTPACDLCAHNNPHPHPIPLCCSDWLDAEGHIQGKTGS